MGKYNRTKCGRHHYIMTLIFTLVSLYAIVAFTFLSFYFIAREDAVRLGEVSVSEQSEKLNNFLLRGKDVVEVVKISIEHMMETDASVDEIQLYLTHQSREYSEKIDENFTGIYALYKGEYVDGMGWTPSDDYDPISRPWYEAAKKADGKPVIVSPYIDAQTDKIMISISQMLSDKESVISLDIAMDDMQDFAESINLNGNGYGFIIDEEGMVVAHSDESQRGKNYLYDGDMQGTKMQEIVRKVIDSDGKTVNVRINGEDSRVFSKVVQGRWHVVMIVNVHDLFKKV
ncbi:MAG: cache domain-containing protein, partial [Lachnospiraceae bacterium]|nr:cache domain-containing protein [Lachnospiraceae bacterium]